MANDSAEDLNSYIDKFAAHLDTFIMTSEMGYNAKLASDMFVPHLSELKHMVALFSSKSDSRNSMAKSASASLYASANDLFLAISSSESDEFNNQSILRSATQLKEVLASARRTYLSRDSLLRMARI
jgi:hypothetical protein